jgi:hypothetical protein
MKLPYDYQQDHKHIPVVAPSLIQATAPPLSLPSPLYQILIKMEEEAPNKRNEVAILTDHVFVLILNRLSTRSLCSYKCVYHS